MTQPAQTKAVAVKSQTPVDEVKSTLGSEEFRQQLKMALPPHIQVDKFVRVAITAVTQNRDIANNRPAFYAACLKAAADGLIPDGKEAALVKFGDDVAYMPMIGGILKKVRNSGELASIDAQVVFEHDKFTYRPGMDDVPIFEPNWFGKRGEAIGVYAVARTKEGAAYVEILSKEDIGAFEKVARTKTVWTSGFKYEMWRKSALRRLSKRLPMSTDLEQVIQRDDDLVDLDKPTDTPETPKTTSSRLSKIIGTPTPPAPVEKTKAPATETAQAEVVEPNESPLTAEEEEGLPI